MDTAVMKAIISLFIVTLFSLPVSAQEEFTSAQIKQYKSGIFEVIALKPEDKTTYKDEFPFDLIPFQFRNDKYYSLGTAFLIDDNTFVSAAHVFAIGQRSIYADDFAVRDDNGKVFEIVNVEKYSNYRDLIQFTVKQDTSEYHKFTIADELNEEGDTIYAAGNALGEGVIFRKGTLTSYTFEPINGLWKNLRFSAAASPGNSGGPLLNLSGEVVGIVTKKSSNENLNHAFPIKEFMEFSTEKAEFVDKQIGEVESGKRLMFGWDFSAQLPMEITKLRDLAEESLIETFLVGREQFTSKFKDEIFPNHENVGKYLKNQSSSESLAIIDANGHREWSLFTADDERQVKIDNNQHLWYASSDKILGNYQFFLEKPEDLPLADFIGNKKLILDTFLNAMKWNRRVQNTEVYIESFGEPNYQEFHTDVYGRTWNMATWLDNYSNSGMLLYCLPIPQGVVCDFMTTGAPWLEIQKSGYKDNLHRMMLSYTAKLSEWKEFLDLPKTKIPKFLHNAEIEISDDTVSYKLGEFAGIMQDMELNEDSSLYITSEISPQDINQLIVSYFRFRPNLNENNFYSVSKFYDQKEDGSESFTDSWNKFVAQQHPYDFSVVDEGGVILKQMNLGASELAPEGFAAGDEETGYLAICELESSKGAEELDSKCDKFIGSIRTLD